MRVGTYRPAGAEQDESGNGERRRGRLASRRLHPPLPTGSHIRPPGLNAGERATESGDERILGAKKKKKKKMMMIGEGMTFACREDGRPDASVVMRMLCWGRKVAGWLRVGTDEEKAA